jgi:uncharacterized repeat protein (TIGR01451 family)
MKTTFTNISRLTVLGCIFASVTLISTLIAPTPTVQALDGFPIAENFRNSTAPGWVLGGNENYKAKLTAAQTTGTDKCGNSTLDAAGNGWLRLTENQQNQAGYAYFDTAFPTNHGVSVTFEYAIYNGSTPGADGIGFFLFDGSVNQNTFNIGGYGGSFGYAQRTNVPGISKGYLGVGFDEYGNYANPTEGRNGGIGFVNDSVSLRGPGNGATGYGFLTSSGTLPYSIDTSSRGLAPTDAKYRRAFIDLLPTSTGYNVSVRIQHGSTIETVINSYPVTNPPASLKLGYSASTGALTNCHEIRNLSINKPVDLKVSKKRLTTTTANPKIGDTIDYEIVALNEGPNTDNDATLTDIVPNYISDVTWKCDTVTASAECVTKAGTGNNITTKVKLPLNGKVKVIVSGKLTTETPFKIVNTASILQSTEFTDVDISDNSSTDTSSLDPNSVKLGTQGGAVTNPSTVTSVVTSGGTVTTSGETTQTTAQKTASNPTGKLLRTGGSSR